MTERHPTYKKNPAPEIPKGSSLADLRETRP